MTCSSSAALAEDLDGIGMIIIAIWKERHSHHHMDRWTGRDRIPGPWSRPWLSYCQRRWPVVVGNLSAVI